MSDDTPTQRFDATGNGGSGDGIPGTGGTNPSDDAATELLSQQHASHEQHAHRDEPTEDETKSKRLIIITPRGATIWYGSK